MKKCKIHVGVSIALLILLTGFKKNTQHQGLLSSKSVNPTIGVSSFAEPVNVSIANATAIQGDKGQRPVKVMVYLSRAAAEPVTVEYSTENGSAKAGVDYVATKGSVTFQPGEAAKWITVLIIGEVAADPDEDATPPSNVELLIMIQKVIGGFIQKKSAIITIIQNIARNLPVVGSDQAVYEVIISYTGFILLYGSDPEECGIRSDGTVVLSGLLSGIENVASDDDITYTGNLDMIINIDICNAYRLPGSSEDKYCPMRVDGSGKVFTELEINYADRDSARGGYIKIENKDGQFTRTVTGECSEEVDAEWIAIPNKSIASVFNGTELPMLKTRTLRKGIYESIGERGTKMVVEVLRKIR